ncbi:conserved hypothetical protein [Nostocoides australiense Ben110]|uniref:Uncharacterized protein n=1 Tax=Nostocoides australiense Ben110 TaxID=1193182 RepID=W6JZA9_9MICO|nr:DUF1028 domain-containing protein [Tetrasphaera australiensis]CCH74517.1 conserved hypothetical protein [Tetrasphaera australiensis Ben110]
MTYSILLRDNGTGDIGVAVQSHFFAVGRFVPWAAAGVGVIATQSIVEPRYGRDGLRLLRDGAHPGEALDVLRENDPDHEMRQVAIMDTQGAIAAFTGANCIPAAGHVTDTGISVQANLVESDGVWPAMVQAAQGEGTLARRLLAALTAAESAGGDIRGQQSAALLVVKSSDTGRLTEDCVVDLRVDDSTDPLGELERLLRHHEAFGGLLEMLMTEGLLSGELTADQATIANTLDVLGRAQVVLGDDNVEPTVWRGLLLARCGEKDVARRAFRDASAAEPRTPELVRRLAAAGMWSGTDDALDALLTP